MTSDNISHSNINSGQLDLNGLKNLFLLYRERSVTGAAKVAGVTQPSMSRTLQKLREEYNDRLFIRQKDQLVPTAKAEFLMTQLAPLFEQIFQVVEAAEPLKPDLATGNFHFCAPDFVSKFAMDNLPTGILQVAPRLEFYYSYWSDSVSEQLKSGELDLAFGYIPECPNHVKCMPIAEDDLVLVYRPEMQGQSFETVEQLLSKPHIALSHSGVMDDEVDRMLAAKGLQRHRVVITPDVEAAFKLLMKADYLMVVPRKMAEYFVPQAIVHTLPVADLKVSYGIYWGAVKDQDNLHKFIREIIIKAFQQYWSAFA